jgi:hypothetical protein
MYIWVECYIHIGGQGVTHVYVDRVLHLCRWAGCYTYVGGWDP